jgi:hypothetical protein
MRLHDRTLIMAIVVASGCTRASDLPSAGSETDVTAEGTTSSATESTSRGPGSSTDTTNTTNTSTSADADSGSDDTGDSSTGGEGGPCDPSSQADLSSFGLGDAMSHPAPVDGPSVYSPPGDWLPGTDDFVGLGQTYTDPVFGTDITRITDVHPESSNSQIYVRNGFWSADGSLFMHHRNGCFADLVDTTTGAVVRDNVPGCFRASFDPVDPDALYYPSGTSLMRYDVTRGEAAIMKDFGGELESLGGSVDYIDRSGRYFVVNVAGTVQVWDKQDDVLYGGTLSGAQVGTGWVGISPDASYLIVPGDFEFHSYAIDHETRTVDTNGTLFWTLCGDHADIVSASDGKTYLVAFECWSEAAVYRVDVTIPQTGDDDAGRDKQRSDNVRLIDLEWSEGGHISCAAAGRYRDWCFYSATTGDDTFENPGPWRPYKQEVLVMQTVEPFEVRRLAHHRSRSVYDSYWRQPRVSASWCGNVVGWVSNFGDNGAEYADAYVIHMP